MKISKLGWVKLWSWLVLLSVILFVGQSNKVDERRLDFFISPAYQASQVRQLNIFGAAFWVCLVGLLVSLARWAWAKPQDRLGNVGSASFNQSGNFAQAPRPATRPPPVASQVRRWWHNQLLMFLVVLASCVVLMAGCNLLSTGSVFGGKSQEEKDADAKFKAWEKRFPPDKRLPLK